MVLGLIRRYAPWIAIGLGLLLAAALRDPAAGPPIFDGLPLPQAPYRYCSPPPNLKSSNERPLPGQSQLPVRNGQMEGSGVQTEDGQLTVFFGSGALQVSPSATSVTVRIDPVCETIVPPPGLVVRGNVYRIAATEDPSGTAAAAAHAFVVSLVYPPGPLNDIEFFDGTSWQPLPTHHASANPVASATLTALGEVAAVGPAGGESTLSFFLRLLQTYGFLAFIILFVIIGVTGEVRSLLRKRR